MSYIAPKNTNVKNAKFKLHEINSPLTCNIFDDVLYSKDVRTNKQYYKSICFVKCLLKLKFGKY